VAITLISSSFEHGQPIPLRHTGDGVNTSPPLAWSGVPAEARSLALICDDPDAPKKTWVHWVVYGLPPTALMLAEGMPTTPTLPDGGKQGTTDFGTVGYGGPAPPKGKLHRYFFKLFALDAEVNLPPGLTKADLLAAMNGRILAAAELVGTYQR
jgi:Raf kinase inhibitor-like YbhB/YbcL family protein